jgi:hypothetical protein
VLVLPDVARLADADAVAQGLLGAELLQRAHHWHYLLQISLAAVLPADAAVLHKLQLVLSTHFWVVSPSELSFGRSLALVLGNAGTRRVASFADEPVFADADGLVSALHRAELL